MDNPKVKWAVGLVAVLALAAATYLGVKLPTQPEYVEPPAGASTQLYDLTVQNDLAVGGDLTVGTGGNYPVENNSANQLFEFGATGAITTTAVTPVAITTVTAYGCSVSNPNASARECWAVESGGVLTFTIYGAQATPIAITTPHAATFWVAGQ